MYHLQGLVVALNCELPPKYVGVKVLAGKYNGKEFSMLTYLVSVSVRLLLAEAIGFPSCTKQAPSPLWEASACTVTGFVLS